MNYSDKAPPGRLHQIDVPAGVSRLGRIACGFKVRQNNYGIFTMDTGVLKTPLFG